MPSFIIIMRSIINIIMREGLRPSGGRAEVGVSDGPAT